VAQESLEVLTMKIVAVILLLSLPLFAQHSVALTWIQSTDTVTGNKVYRGTTTGGPYNTTVTICTTPCTTYTDTQVTAGGKYFYVVTALNGTAESAYSNEVSAVIPQAAPSGLTAVVK
jgi:fibronectin type 3 domain-containing protein